MPRKAKLIVPLVLAGTIHKMQAIPEAEYNLCQMSVINNVNCKGGHIIPGPGTIKK